MSRLKLEANFNGKNMADEKWQKVREIFDAALCRQPDERARFVNKVCGNDKTLLREVESLLKSLGSADSFMETPAVAKVAYVIEAEQRKINPGTCFGHYEIIKQIGAGGMGEVYLAKDKKLDRQVAIKILNEKFAGQESNLKRFIKEAKAASALNHPNILTIYEFVEADETHFIVSEFVEGQTLREIISQSRLGFPEVFDFSIQIAGALSAAHKAHLVHRDIKPENIMIRPDGYIKILDFGLAKLIQPKQALVGLENETAQQSETAKGVIMGTINYMSPEQAKGEKVDERTDIFSFGVVIYEMLTSKTPFQGNSISETFANLINAEPQPMGRFAKEIPAELQLIVSKMLRKGKNARYHTMKGLLADLKDLNENLTLEAKLERSTAPQNGNATEVLQATTGDANLTTAQTQNSISQQIKQRPFVAVALIALLIGSISFGIWYFSPKNMTLSGKKSIAILPVQPLTAENRDVIYEFGIADSLTLKLGAAKNLIVRPLSATRQYADITQDAIVAGKEMQVDYVLASNYQIANGKIRVTAQLFNVSTGQAEETYKSEKNVGNIFATQDAIAGEVGNILLARFLETESSPLAKRGTTNEEAYRLYLLGKNLTMQRSVEEQKAIEYLEQAIRLDPNFARGYAGLAYAYKDREKAKAAVEKALELDNNLSEAYAVRGSLNLFKIWCDFAQAEKDILRAIELDPNNDLAHWLYGLLRSYQGRFDEAIREIETASAISPATVVYIRDRARTLYYARRYTEAIVQYKRVLETDEDFVSAQNQLLMSYEMNGDYAMAYETFIKQREERKDEHLEDYKKVYAAAGWQGMMRKHFELHQVNENEPGTNFYSIARQCAMLGEKEQAFAYLNKSFEKRQYQMVFIYVEPRFDSLRDDPRFDELVRRVGLK